MRFIHSSAHPLSADTGKALRIQVNFAPSVAVSWDHDIEAVVGKINRI